MANDPIQASNKFEYGEHECAKCGEKKMISIKVDSIIDQSATEARIMRPELPQSWQFKPGDKYMHCQSCKHIWKDGEE